MDALFLQRRKSKERQRQQAEERRRKRQQQQEQQKQVKQQQQQHQAKSSTAKRPPDIHHDGESSDSSDGNGKLSFRRRLKKEGNADKKKTMSSGSWLTTQKRPPPNEASRLPVPTASNHTSNKRTLPSNVGYAALKTSPSSSVSMSQSPAVAKRKATYDSDSDSSIDDTDLKIQRLKLAAQQREQAKINNNNNNKPPRIPNRSAARALDMEEEDDNNKSDSEDDDTSHDRPTHRYATKKQTAAPKQRNSSIQNKVVRNPLVLMKQEQEQIQPVPATAQAAPPQRNASRSLWSDSEDDTADESASGPVRKTKQKQRVIVELPPKKKRKTGSKKGRWDSSNLPGPSPVDENNLQAAKPEFPRPRFLNDPAVPLELKLNDKVLCVPVSINRYLAGYQQTGIRFMFEKAIATKRGAILGDDMGLGKTVMTISLLAALFEKTGTAADYHELLRRQKVVREYDDKLQAEKESALASGRLFVNDRQRQDDAKVRKELGLPAWSPALIVAPNSVVTNWVTDFDTWGYFGVGVYHGSGKEKALEKAERGDAEVLVCAQSMFQNQPTFLKLLGAQVRWKLIILDEFHNYRNEKGQLSKNLRVFRDQHQAIVIGLTGTVMPNRHQELHNLVDLVAHDFLGSWKQFMAEFAQPIKLSMARDAEHGAVEYGRSQDRLLKERLCELYLKRTKEEVLAGDLPDKNERVIFCEPSRLQKDVYEYMIEQPDFVLLRRCNGPCDCGVNQKFFVEYQRLRTKADKIEYQRRNRRQIVKRKECCYKMPMVGEEDDRRIDPGAVLWQQIESHDEIAPCKVCPHCIGLPAMDMLRKVASHAALLQASKHPDEFLEGSKDRAAAQKWLDRAKQFIPEHLLSHLPGGYVRQSGIMDDHFALSGKMTVLDKLLKYIKSRQGRVLLFSAWTASLDLVQNFIESDGYSFLRMDGQTSMARRIEIADRFRKNPDVMIFLLSTKAMGLGLNLTEANFVIILDPDWNPANDDQAQDRAYRIGQEQDVTVFRLVTQGTIDEQRFLRQIYKKDVTARTIDEQPDDVDSDSPKDLKFRGVMEDEGRKGELFGIENLLKFKDGRFLNYPLNKAESRKCGVAVYDPRKMPQSEENDGIDINNVLYGEPDLEEEVRNMPPAVLEGTSRNPAAKKAPIERRQGDPPNRAAALKKDPSESDEASDEDDDEEDHHVGGISQAVADILESNAADMPPPADIPPPAGLPPVPPPANIPPARVVQARDQNGGNSDNEESESEDDEDDYHVGGISQGIDEICAANVHFAFNPQDGSDSYNIDQETAAVGSSNTQGNQLANPPVVQPRPAGMPPGVVAQPNRLAAIPAQHSVQPRSAAVRDGLAEQALPPILEHGSPPAALPGQPGSEETAQDKTQRQDRETSELGQNSQSQPRGQDVEIADRSPGSAEDPESSTGGGIASYELIETQSPVRLSQIGVVDDPTASEEKDVEDPPKIAAASPESQNNEAELPSQDPPKKAATSPESQGKEAGSPKKSSPGVSAASSNRPRNMKLLGKTTDQIRRNGRNGFRTTFSAMDFPKPKKKGS